MAEADIEPAEDLLAQRDLLIDEVFKMFDKDDSGFIDVRELKHALYSMGREVDDKQLKDFLKEYDKDNNDSLSKNEFHQMLDRLYSVPEQEVEEVIEAFKLFDYNNSKTISLKELKNILTKYSNDFTEEECEELFKMIDKDGSGEITYEEFVNHWKYQ